MGGVSWVRRVSIVEENEADSGDGQRERLAGMCNRAAHGEGMSPVPFIGPWSLAAATES